MAGKVCVVTGAGSGIGAATAELFAEHGASAVVCADVDLDAAEATARRIDDAGHTAAAVAVDVSRPEDCARLAARVVDAFSGVHVLHNNAGVGRPGAVDELADSDWDLTIGVNLRGTFLMSKALLPTMLAQKAPSSIVNTCSTFATVGSPRLAAYHASKGGVRALTRQMARDYSPRIRVNSVSPGVTDTGMTRGGVATEEDPAGAWRHLAGTNHYFGRAATPREIAHGVLFLASDEAGFVTGHDLVMSGGQGEVAF